MKYQMKDLGYPRTPTSAIVRITMEHECWDVPAQIIADSRDANYADEKEDTIGFIRDGSLDRGAINDWGSNNMNWDDVEEYATQCESERPVQDLQEGWVNGDWNIVGKL